MPLALIEVQTPLIPRHHSSALCVPSASLTWLCSVLWLPAPRLSARLVCLAVCGPARHRQP